MTHWTRPLLIVLSMALAVGHSFGKSFTLSVSPSYQIGYNDYTIRFPVGNGLDVESELTFPTDGAYLNYELEFFPSSKSAKHFFFGASFSHNIHNPFLPMHDEDRLTDGGTDDLVFSDTESSANARIFQADILIGKNLIAKEKVDLAIIFGYQFYGALYNIYGAKGFQLDKYENKVHFDLFPDDVVLRYNVFQHLPYVGVRASLPRKKVRWDAQLKIAPSLVHDYDDHVLRKKDARTLAFGIAALYRIKMSFHFLKNPEWSTGILLEGKGLIAFGKQVQSWYGNDPAATGDETGTKSGRIDNTLISISGQLGWFLTYGF